MIVARAKKTLKPLVTRWKAARLSIGFVPTMGALHAGHASLIKRARRECDKVVVSIFVNPTQFGPKEDLSRYPRPFAKDKKLCASLGVDAVYHPPTNGMYPNGFSSFVEVEGLSEVLCGKFRPGHFRGVATVVLKLFETIQPDRAYFGEKDYQQLAIIRKMTRDLDLPVRVIGCPTVREKDGLALSSRNAYLTPAERAVAPLLHQALEEGRRLAERRGGTRAGVERLVKREICRIPGARVEYASLVDAETLLPARRLQGRLRLLAAMRLGRARLIDNLPVSC